MTQTKKFISKIKAIHIVLFLLLTFIFIINAAVFIDLGFRDGLGVFFLFLTIAVTITGFIGIISPKTIRQKSRIHVFGKGSIVFFVCILSLIITIPKNTTESPEVTTNIRAHSYKVIKADTDGKGRGGTWYITSPATSKDDRAYTTIQATKDLIQAMAEPQYAIVRMVLNEKHFGTIVGKIIASVDYEIDKKGNESWSVYSDDYVLDSKKQKIFDGWLRYREKFKDSNDLVNEEKLTAFLSKKLEIPESEVTIYMPPIKKYPYNKETKYKIIGLKNNSSVPNPEEFKISACQRDTKCWGNEHSFAANRRCRDAIEALAEKVANYSFEWTDGTLDSKFPLFRMNNRKTGELTYVGNKIKFQNGFGAWTRYSYECDYLPSKKQVVDVRFLEN